MTPFDATSSWFFSWLVWSSVQVSLVVLVLLAVQAAFGRTLAPRWMYVLWMIPLVRLLLPWAPENRYSLDHALTTAAAAWSPATTETVADATSLDDAAPETAAEPATPIPETPAMATPAVVKPAVETPAPAPSAMATPTPAKPAEATRNAPIEAPSVVASPPVSREDLPPPCPIGWTAWFWPGLWLAGAVPIGAYVFWLQFRLWLSIRNRRPITDPDVLNLLEECKERMGVGTLLAIVPTDRVPSPALFGVVRPRLLFRRR